MNITTADFAANVKAIRAEFVHGDFHTACIMLGTAEYNIHRVRGKSRVGTKAAQKEARRAVKLAEEVRAAWAMVVLTSFMVGVRY